MEPRICIFICNPICSNKIINLILLRIFSQLIYMDSLDDC